MHIYKLPEQHKEQTHIKTKQNDKFKVLELIKQQNTVS